MPYVTVEAEVFVDLDEISDAEIKEEYDARKLGDRPPDTDDFPEHLYLFLRTLPEVPPAVRDWVWAKYGRVL